MNNTLRSLLIASALIGHVTGQEMTAQWLTRTSSPLRIIKKTKLSGDVFNFDVKNVGNESIKLKIWKKEDISKGVGAAYSVTVEPGASVDSIFKLIDQNQEYAFTVVTEDAGQKISPLLKIMRGVEPGASYEEVDCTQYMYRALLKAGYDLSDDFVKRIFMNDVKPGQFVDLLIKSDGRMSGAAGALAASGQADIISKWEDAKPGDVVQYWRVSRNPETGIITSVLYGHSGIVDKSNGRGRLDLYGSHKQEGGVGTLKGIDLGSSEYQGWIVRPK